MNNASRSGAVVNVSIEDIANANSDGDMMVATSLDHKTLVATGPANLRLTLDKFWHLNILTSKIGPQIVSASLKEATKISLTCHGQPLSA